MKVDEIRDRFLRFFKERGHTVYPSDSLVPAKDRTLLFTGAGMNQFKEEFLGRVKGPRRAVTCQKCLRTGDLEKVGKTPDHHTFFEMLGNFSFGDYFKKDAIIWAWEFLTGELKLKDKDLWASVYKDDDEAYDIWKKSIKLPAERILRLGAEENFWPSDAPTKGPNGPCGPCSEIFYGGPDGVEVWNLVFTQFDRKDRGILEPLPSKNIDTGMGLERIARVLQGKSTNFEIDSFQVIVKAIKDICSVKKNDKIKVNAVADHIRAAVFAVADGVFPSNEERGYIVRKLIRKAFWYGRAFGLESPFLYRIVPAVAKVMERAYPELTEQREDIAQVVLSEENRFCDTIEAGLERLNEMIDASRASGVLSGEGAFKLYDTFGFPLELTQEIAGIEKMRIGLAGFERSMKKQRARSKKGAKIKSAIFDSDMIMALPEKTIFVEDKEEIETNVLQVSGNSVFLKETNFYGEKGGQVGDIGWLIKDGKVAAEVINSVDIAGRVRHEVKIKEGDLKKRDKVTAKIDAGRREKIKKNHTATHLLHNALRKVLGLHVKQAGSLVAPDHLRFDFTHFKALTDEELFRVEHIVNENIRKNSPVGIKSLSFDEAKKQGAIALFGEKYENEVRMVCVGDYSRELCGGTHVGQTKDIKRFKILSESSIAGGTRRIEAITGAAVGEKDKEKAALMKQIADELKTTPGGVPGRVEGLINKLRDIERALGIARSALAHSIAEHALNSAKEIKGNKIILAEIKNGDMDLLRKSADIIKDKLGKDKGIFVLVSGGSENTYVVVGINSLPKEGQLKINANRILNCIGADFGIKGGGRPDFAQAGGSSRADIKKMLKRAEDVIGNSL